MLSDGQAVLERVRAAIVRTGWSATARRAGVSRVTLHRAFTQRPNRTSTSFATVAAVAAALGLRLVVTAIESDQLAGDTNG